MIALFTLLAHTTTLTSSMSESATAAFDLRFDLSVGYSLATLEGSETLVGEHEPFSSRPRLEGTLGLETGWLRIAADGRLSDERVYAGSVGAELGRVARVDLEASRSLHRLDHDPLGYLGFAGVAGLDVLDRDPGRAYSVERGRLGPSLRVDLPAVGPVSDLRLSARYHSETREGHEQARTITHCGSCHVEAATRPIDQLTQELTIGLEGRVSGRLGLAAELSARALDERGRAPELLEAFEPPLLANLISVRGRLPFGVTNDNQRTRVLTRASYRGPAGVDAGLTYQWARAQSSESGLAATSQLFGARLSVRPSATLQAKAHYRLEDTRSVVPAAVDRFNHGAGLDADLGLGRFLRLSGGYAFQRLTRDNVLLFRRSGDTAAGQLFIDERGRQSEARNEMRLNASVWHPAHLRGRIGYRLVLLDGPLSTLARQTSFAPSSGSRPHPDTLGILPSLSSVPSHLHELSLDVGGTVARELAVHPRYLLRASGGSTSERDGVDQALGGVVTWTPTSWLGAAGSCQFLRNRIRTRLYYGQVGGLTSSDGFVDVDEVSYLGFAHAGMISAWILPIDRLTLRGEASWVRGASEFTSSGQSEPDVGALSAIGADLRRAQLSIEGRATANLAIGAVGNFSQVLDLPTRRRDGRAVSFWVYLRLLEVGSP